MTASVERCREIYWQLHQQFACKNAGFAGAVCRAGPRAWVGRRYIIHAPMGLRLTGAPMGPGPSV